MGLAKVDNVPVPFLGRRDQVSLFLFKCSALRDGARERSGGYGHRYCRALVGVVLYRGQDGYLANRKNHF